MVHIEYGGPAGIRTRIARIKSPAISLLLRQVHLINRGREQPCRSQAMLLLPYEHRESSYAGEQSAS